MNLKRALIVAALAAGLAGAAALSKEGETTGQKMVEAASKFVDGLRDEQKKKALFDFDDKERTNWWFVPLQEKKKPLRKGLRLDEMSPEQQQAARTLLKAGTSESGYTKASTIIGLESILRDLEKNGANVRDPGWYFVSIFGEPSRTGRWGWRIEGHHLSLNFVVDKSKVTAATPSFFGANPANVRDGDKKGLRTLAEAEDLARALFAALDEDQAKVALQPKQFEEIEQGKPAPTVGKPVGLPASKMTAGQKATLEKLLKAYANRLPADLAAAEMETIKEAGLDNVHFAFAQENDKPGKPYTYRVQGPSVLLEFLNVQPDSAGNPANHVHSSLREMKGDFGLSRP